MQPGDDDNDDDDERQQHRKTSLPLRVINANETNVRKWPCTGIINIPSGSPRDDANTFILKCISNASAGTRAAQSINQSRFMRNAERTGGKYNASQHFMRARAIARLSRSLRVPELKWARTRTHIHYMYPPLICESQKENIVCWRKTPTHTHFHNLTLALLLMLSST